MNEKKIAGIVWGFIFLFGLTSAAYNQSFVKRTGGYFWGGQMRWGPYKTFGSLFWNLQRNAKIAVIHPRNETVIFRSLLSQLYAPRYLLFEGTFYPTTGLSAFLETDEPRFFNRFNTYYDLNLLRTISTSQEEPYALSLFLGNIIFFKKNWLSTKTRLQTGSALAGFAMAGGHWHIQDNIRINDNWYELLYLITVRMEESRVQKMLWDVRIGYKAHQNPIVTDVVVLYLNRSHSDWNRKNWGLVKNSEMTVRINFPTSKTVKGRPFISRFYFVFSKKYPIRIWKYRLLLKLGGGFVWAFLRRFDRDLRQFEQQESSKLIWLIKPNIEF